MLKERIITALISVAVLLLVLFVLPRAAAQAVIAVVVLAGAWEWSGFLGARATSVRGLYVGLIAALIGLVTWQAPQLNGLLFQTALVWWICALVWTLFYPTPIPAIVRWGAGVGLRGASGGRAQTDVRSDESLENRLYVRQRRSIIELEARRAVARRRRAVDP